MDTNQSSSLLNGNEKKFLLSVERGDIATVRDLLKLSRDELGIDCQDPLGRTALLIAIDNENIHMVRLLVKSGIRTGDALLHAINENFVEAVELLLDEEQSTHKQGQLYSWQRDRDYSIFSADVTPLILAAHRNNFEIIKILLERNVSPLPSPHDPRCECNTCCAARAEDCLKHSRSRINAFRALASPSLIALSSFDPLLTAFELSYKLENLSVLEPEYRSDYLELRRHCQSFATALLDHTRTSRELQTLLNHSDEYDEDYGANATNHSNYSDSDNEDDHKYYSHDHHTHQHQHQHHCHHCNHPASCFGTKCQQKEGGPRITIPFEAKQSLLSIDSVTGRIESYHSHMRLARLKLAIRCKQKTFCAHPNVQQLLASMWYDNLPGFRRKSSLNQALQVILIGLLFPIFSIAYLVAPKTQMGRYIKKPFIKFICHSASYMTFLIILILASQRIEAFYKWPIISNLFMSRHENDHYAKFLFASRVDPDGTEHPIESGTTDGKTRVDDLADRLSQYLKESSAASKKSGAGPTPIELLILFWVIGLIWAEWKQIRALGLEYYRSNMWNTLDSVANCLYIASICLRVIAYLQQDKNSSKLAREHWTPYDPTLLSEGLFAAATIFSALKLVYIFLVNPYLGPLQISLGRMIIDILKFAWIYVLVLFAFACGMNQLLWYYADLERHQCLNMTHGNLVNSAAVNGSVLPVSVMADPSCKVWRHFSNVFESSQTLFWATFGLVDLENFDLIGIKQYTRFWALLMFGVYCFINVIVVLNLLIAMMNHSYEKISGKSDVEWKFARTRLWMSYFDTGSTVPPPFNILPSMKSLQAGWGMLRRLTGRLLFFQEHRGAKRKSADGTTTTTTANTTTTAVNDMFTELDMVAGSSGCRVSQGIAAPANVQPEAPTVGSFPVAGSGCCCCRQAKQLRVKDGKMANTLDASYQNNENRKKVCHVDHSGRYQDVIKALIRRYIINEQRALEKNRELTEDDCNEIKQEVSALRYELMYLLGGRHRLRHDEATLMYQTQQTLVGGQAERIPVYPLGSMQPHPSGIGCEQLTRPPPPMAPGLMGALAAGVTVDPLMGCASASHPDPSTVSGAGKRTRQRERRLIRGLKLDPPLSIR